MTISPTVSLVLMWVFLIGMYIFKTADMDAPPTLAAFEASEVLQEEVEEQEAEVQTQHMNLVVNTDHKFKVYRFDSKECEKSKIKVWTNSNGSNKVLWSSHNHEDGQHNDEHSHSEWKTEGDHVIWSSGNHDVKILTSQGLKNKIYKIKDLKEIKEKYKELKLKEGNKAISVYSTSPHNIKIKTIQKEGN